MLVCWILKCFIACYLCLTLLLSSPPTWFVSLINTIIPCFSSAFFFKYYFRVGMPKRGRDEEGDVSSTSSSIGTAVDSSEATSFATYVWNEVSMLLFHRITRCVQDWCYRVAAAAPSSALQQSILDQLTLELFVIWASGKRHLTRQDNSASYDAILQYIAKLAARAPELTATSFDSCAAVLRGVVRFVEEEGFFVEESQLARLAGLSKQRDEAGGYSYSARTTLTLPLLPRYEGDKRSEEEHTHARSGYDVQLPNPHPHREINTTVQLIEPKKRKPILDEYRIFSHPKKAATHAAEDFLVDEELTHRGYVVLAHHLDTYGSLERVSPYVRFLLWNAMDRDDNICDALFEKLSSASTVAVMADVRRFLAAKLAAFTTIRPSSRNAAQQLGWFAASAQWRDQVVKKLEEIDEGDWYLLADSAKNGGRAVFPNYASDKRTRTFGLALIEKLDRVHASTGEAASIPVHSFVATTLLPFLCSACPPQKALQSLPLPQASVLLPPPSRQPRVSEQQTSPSGGLISQSLLSRCYRRMSGAMDGAHKIRWSAPEEGNSSRVGGGPGVCATFICPSMVFPLQCVGELLELCAKAELSIKGFEHFADSFLRADWCTEEEVIRFLLDSEPLNAAIAPLAGLPRIYRDLVTSVQLLLTDCAFPFTLLARQHAESLSNVRLSERDYNYWKALSELCQDDDYHCPLLCLETRTSDQGGEAVAPRNGMTAAYLEKMPLVWPGEVDELIEEEKNFSSLHDCQTLFRSALEQLNGNN